MERLLLVDADQLFYQHTSAHQHEEVLRGDEWEDAWLYEGDIVLLCDIQSAVEGINSSLSSLSAGYDRTILCFTSTPNFRHQVLPSYKGGRLKKRKPLGYWDLIDQWCDKDPENTKKIPGLEADDVMSIIATNPKYLRQYKMAIWSQDKDMAQVPDTLIIKPDGHTDTFCLEEANHFRYTQALTGDVTDGYAGLKGVGPVAASRLLDGLEGSDEETYLDAVISAYMDSGATTQQALAQVNCACILRFHEFDFEMKQPILKGVDR